MLNYQRVVSGHKKKCLGKSQFQDDLPSGKASFSGIRKEMYPRNMANNVVLTYLHFRILVFRGLQVSSNVLVHPKNHVVLIGGIPTSLKSMKRLGLWNSQLLLRKE